MPPVQYWIEVQWPPTDGSPRQEYFVWYHEGNVERSRQVHEGDRVLIYETKKYGGSETVFVAGTISALREDIDEQRGGSHWVRRIGVIPDSDATLEPKEGIPLKRANELLGWKSTSRFREGRPINKDQFAALVTELRRLKSGVHRTSGRHPTMYCRICWNTQGWQRPTGEAAKLESSASYVAENGFGHEEWLFNVGYQIEGRQYGYLQPLDKGHVKWPGQTLDLILYTISPTGDWFAVSKISNCRILGEANDKEELDDVVEHYRKAGWFAEMQSDLNQTGIQTTMPPLNAPNVCFAFDDVVFFRPFKPIGPNHKLRRNRRYQLTEATPTDISQFETTQEEPPNRRNKTFKSEQSRQRAAQKGTQYDPVHDRMQRALTELLQDRFGTDQVGYEEDYVDIRLDYRIDDVGHTIYFEVKTDNTAKGCIRSAIGQLMEYACYPSACRATGLVVVGPRPYTPEDVMFLKHLQETFQLPIGYWHFDLERRTVVSQAGSKETIIHLSGGANA